MNSHQGHFRKGFFGFKVDSGCSMYENKKILVVEKDNGIRGIVW